jgi:5'-nucleotidase
MSKPDRPLILITNDDGIDAAGLRILAEVMQDVGQVVVVAPDRERSAVGHGISLTRPLRITGREPDRFAISGSPVDAVLLGLFKLCPRRPDLVVSGINLGLNLGTDVLYSGTLAAALEGAIHDVPAMAVSQELPRGEEAPPLAELLRRTGRFAAQLVLGLCDHPLPPRTVLSINAPAAQTDEMRWTRLGRRIYRERIEERLDLRGIPYYWIGGPVIRNTDGPGTDAHAVESGALSLTLVGLDLTVELPDWYDRWRVEGYRRVEGEG